MKEPATELGKRIRESRARKGLSQEQLARMAEVSTMTIRRAETTDSKLNEATQIAIAKALEDPKLFPPSDPKDLYEAFKRLDERRVQAEYEQEMAITKQLKLVQKILALRSEEDIAALVPIVDLMLSKQEEKQDEKESGEES